MIYSLSKFVAILAVFHLCFVFESVNAFMISPQNQNKFSKVRVKLDMVAHSRFEKMKQRWKGLTPHLPSVEEVGVSYEEFQRGLEETYRSFKLGDIVKGKVEEFLHKGAHVDVGAKAPAWLSETEYGMARIEHPVEEIGYDEIEVQIIRTQDKEGKFAVSIKRLMLDRAWDSTIKMSEEDERFEVEIIAVNRGGAVVSLSNGLRGFLPGSHFVDGNPSEEHIGQKIPVKFLNVDRETNKLMVSNRFAVMEERAKLFTEGVLVEGTVQGIKPYGVFVNIEGISTLLHISQISNARIVNIEELFQIGAKIKAVVIEINPENNRIALSCKILEQSHGDMLKDMQAVFDSAETNLALYKQKKNEEAQKRDEAARDIIEDLGKDVVDSPEREPEKDMEKIEQVATIIEDLNKSVAREDPDTICKETEPEVVA